MCKNPGNKACILTLTFLAAALCFGAFYWLGAAFDMGAQTLEMAGGAAGATGALGLVATAVSNDEACPAWATFGTINGVGIGGVFAIFAILSACAYFWTGLLSLQAGCLWGNLTDCLSGTFCWQSNFWAVTMVSCIGISTLSALGYTFVAGTYETCSQYLDERDQRAAIKEREEAEYLLSREAIPEPAPAAIPEPAPAANASAVPSEDTEPVETLRPDQRVRVHNSVPKAQDRNKDVEMTQQGTTAGNDGNTEKLRRRLHRMIYI